MSFGSEIASESASADIKFLLFLAFCFFSLGASAGALLVYTLMAL